MRGTAKSYQALREYCESVPLVDCHDHSGECGPKRTDPILALMPGYFRSDILQALSCVPHGKIHGYGTDYGGDVECAWAHAQIARDNIAIALSDMVELEYLGLDEAKEVARDWLFDNANAFFGLGL